MAISTETPALSLTNSESVCRETPISLATRVTDQLNGSRHSDLTIPPG